MAHRLGVVAGHLTPLRARAQPRNARQPALRPSPAGAAAAAALIPQAVAVTAPVLLGGALASLWAVWPQLVAVLRSMSRHDALHGTTLTQEALEAFAQGLQNTAATHPPGTFPARAASVASVHDVMSPKFVPVLAIPALARPQAMTRRLCVGWCLLGSLPTSHALRCPGPLWMLRMAGDWCVCG
jgi:hypothetical protein